MLRNRQTAASAKVENNRATTFRRVPIVKTAMSPARFVSATARRSLQSIANVPSRTVRRRWQQSSEPCSRGGVGGRTPRGGRVFPTQRNAPRRGDTSIGRPDPRRVWRCLVECRSTALVGDPEQRFGKRVRAFVCSRVFGRLAPITGSSTTSGK